MTKKLTVEFDRTIMNLKQQSTSKVLNNPDCSLLNEYYIPDLSIENFRSRQFCIFSTLIDSIYFDFVAYPSIHCMINIIDLNLDNKTISNLSTIQYWSVLKGHKGPITEIQYIKKDIINMLISISKEGRCIIWKEKQGRIKHSLFLNEVKYEVDLFSKYKVFNLNTELQSFYLFNNIFSSNDDFFKKNIIAFADNSNIVSIFDLYGDYICEIKENIDVDFSIVSVYQRTSNTLILTGSALNEGFKAYSLITGQLVKKVSFEGDILSIDSNNEHDYILIGSGLGVIKMLHVVNESIIELGTITLDGAIFDLKFWGYDLKHIAIAVDIDKFDRSSSSGFKYIDVDFTNKSQVMIFNSENIIHKSYIINFQLYKSPVNDSHTCITIGLDKRIKVIKI